MTDTIIRASGLRKYYGKVAAVDGIDLDIPKGSILGLLGPNGAGKTTMLRSLLGLSSCEGELSVLGLDPVHQRAELLEQVCFIADTAVLPMWMKVSDLLDYTEGVHPRFNRQQAEDQLSQTNIEANMRVKQLSKGMTVQLHLALVMSIDARLLILDEPTLGLDILFRKRFFEQLLNDYYDSERTIIISTHQVEEVENILTDIMFVANGKKVLSESMESIADSYLELHVTGENVAAAEQLGPMGSRSIFGGKALIFSDPDRDLLSTMGDLRVPSVADLFVAKVQLEG
ncbi:MAG: ABC-2 type transport system ATP-binding protein [Halieaceae bacterium]